MNLERGLRALLIIGAAAVLAWGWGIDTHILGKEDTLFARLVHGALSAVIIFLVADLMWQATKAAIDRKLAEAEDLGQPPARARRLQQGSDDGGPGHHQNRAQHDRGLRGEMEERPGE